ncbi:MAG: PEGA domain-containing protein, partial [Thermoanaerobaculia bacterium]|nr:PEGA domain-containing protein [Thermoanaerobaculia bacterium]
MRRARPASILTLLAVLLLSPSLAAAQEVEDPLQARFDAAMQVFRSADQYDSIELFTGLISELEARDELTPAARELLARSYFFRGEAHFNFGENAEAASNLESAIRVEPNLAIDQAMISPKLAELLAESRRKVVGFLQSEVQPSDAVAYVEGAPPLRVGEAIALLDGEYSVRIERPGFQTVERTVRVPAGQTTNLRVEMARTSAVLHVLTEAPGITVTVDGREAGTTSDDGSGIGALAVDGLEPGTHTIGLSSRGYRDRQLEVELAALDDYSTDVITLEPMRGTIRLAGLLPQSVILGNGEVQQRSGADTATVEVPAGTNLIEVDHRGVGRFSRQVEVADGQAIGLEVELRPVIALLAFLGGDEVGARDLEKGTLAFFRDSEAWTVSDRTDVGESLVEANGFDVGRLREIGMASPAQIGRIDWKPLQQACDRQIGASAYLIGVL